MTLMRLSLLAWATHYHIDGMPTGVVNYSLEVEVEDLSIVQDKL